MNQTYAFFWKRLVAFIIDSIILGIGGAILGFVVALGAGNSTGSNILMQLVSFIIGLLYFALLESGAKQATLGKMAMAIKVVGSNGERISFARAVGRYFAKMISNLTFYFGFFMAAFTRRRQALHDMIATTYVVNNDYQPEQGLPEENFRTEFMWLSIVVSVLMFLMVIAFFALGFLAVLGMAAQGAA